MQVFRSGVPTDTLEGHFSLWGRQIPRKALFPVGLALLAVLGILSPLFNLHQIHGLPSPKLYSQHLYFDGLADAGGFYAASFCKHWYHRLAIAVLFALLTTLALTTLVG